MVLAVAPLIVAVVAVVPDGTTVPSLSLYCCSCLEVERTRAGCSGVQSILISPRANFPSWYLACTLIEVAVCGNDDDNDDGDDDEGSAGKGVVDSDVPSGV